MADWNTRLVVTQGDKMITPISAFNPTFTTDHTVLHSIEADNIGYVRKPQEFTFTMTVQAIGPAVADLTKLAIEGTPFDITVAEQNGTDWSFKSIAFTGCIVTSSSPSNVVIDGAPAANFTCKCLQVTATP
jgi:hypothetical protein